MYNAQSIVLRIKTVLKKREVSVGRMLLDCGLNKNVLSSMQSRGSIPTVETIVKIADYLNCSVDYLLGRDELDYVKIDTSFLEKPNITDEENEQLCVYVEQLFDKIKNPPNPQNISGVELIYFSVKKREYRFTYEALGQISSYFGITVKNLFENSKVNYENKLLHDFRSLSREGQDFIIQTLDVAKSKYSSTAPEKDGYEIAAFGGKETKGATKKTKPEITT